MIISVDMMIHCREERKKRQNIITQRYSVPCLCFYLNIPGPVKTNASTEKIFSKGLEEIEKLLQNSIIHKNIYHETTGSEAYFAINLNAIEIKEKSIYLEEKYSYSRIYDLDVFDVNLNSISRQDLNRSTRKCFICNEAAAICARSRKHSVEELMLEIERLAEAL